jgi:phage virion morphogenesis protein
MRVIGEHIASQVDLTFRDEKDPYGNPWEALSPVTISRRRGNTAGILKDTGHLQRSITSNPSSHEVEIGTNEIYGPTHQFGATQGQYGRNRRNAPIPWGDMFPRVPSCPQKKADCRTTGSRMF